MRYSNMYIYGNNVDNERILKAKELAKESTHYKTKVGCVIIVPNDPVRYYGINSNTKSHPLQAFYNEAYRPFTKSKCNHNLHAETSALLHIKDRKDIQGAKAYIYRISKLGEQMDARPCNACINMFKDYGIMTLYYSTRHGYAIETLI